MGFPGRGVVADRLAAGAGTGQCLGVEMSISQRKQERSRMVERAAEFDRLLAWAQDADGWIGAALDSGRLDYAIERELRRISLNAPALVKGPQP